MNKGASSLFHNIVTYGGELSEYQTIFSLKFYSNQN
jgi:hypothetical protein